jgi:predicted nucleic acid-binding protein
LHQLLEDFQTRPVLEFGAEAIEVCAQIIKLRSRIGIMDLRIASIALSHDALLLSRNLKDFKKYRASKWRTGRANRELQAIVHHPIDIPAASW